MNCGIPPGFQRINYIQIKCIRGEKSFGAWALQVKAGKMNKREFQHGPRKSAPGALGESKKALNNANSPFLILLDASAKSCLFCLS